MGPIACRRGLALLLGCAAARANALTPEMAKTPAVESLPAGAQISKLEVQPAKVVLTGRFESAQLLITARLASPAMSRT